MRIHPLQPIAAVLLIVAFLYIRRKAADKRPTSGGRDGRAESRAVATRPAEVESPEASYRNRRRKALAATADSLGLPALAPDEPHAVLMEIGMSPIVTLATFANGDAGVYYQNGGGMIGGLAHENVRQASRQFLTLGKEALPKLSRIANPPLPEPGNVRFIAVTSQGIFTAEMDREALGEPGNDFAPLFYAGQEVVTQMRQAQEKRAQ